MGEEKKGNGMVGAIPAISQGAGLFMGNQMQQSAEKRQLENSKEMANHMYDLDMRKWRETNYKAQVAEMQKAGLSQGLIYGGAGGGNGMVSSSTSSGAAQPTKSGAESGVQMAEALNLALMESVIDKNKSEAEANRAGAGLSGAQQTTEEQKRETLIENMKQEGIGTWFDNINKRWQIEGDTDMDDEDYTMTVLRNVVYDTSIKGQNADSPNARKFVAELVKTASEGENQKAQSLLNNNKAMGYFTELMIAQQNANSKKTEAYAKKIVAEFSTGEDTNWKTWVDLAERALKLIPLLRGK